MLKELYTSLTSRTAPGARKAGLAREVAGISGRYSRQKEAWENHLQHTKECISAHLHEAEAGEPLLVLGAGLCLDLPLDALNGHPAGSLLVDAVETARARRMVKRYDNLAFELSDITGCLSSSKAPAQVAPIPLAGYGMAISCNILSQLALPFASSPPENDEEKAIITKLQDAHIRALMAMNCPALLITDYERVEMHGDHDHIVTTVDRSHLPGAPLEAWQWYIAPKGEVNRHLDIRLNVGAWLLNA